MAVFTSEPAEIPISKPSCRAGQHCRRQLPVEQTVDGEGLRVIDPRDNG